MICDKKRTPYYVRAKLNSAGTFKRTGKVDEAVRVIWDPINEPNKLKLLVSIEIIL